MKTIAEHLRPALERAEALIREVNSAHGKLLTHVEQCGALDLDDPTQEREVLDALQQVGPPVAALEQALQRATWGEVRAVANVAVVGRQLISNRQERERQARQAEDERERRAREYRAQEAAEEARKERLRQGELV